MSNSPSDAKPDIEPAAPVIPLRRPVVLVVRDGWGDNPNREWDKANAVRLAKTPRSGDLAREYPTTLLATSGFDVGLPEGTMGNSEVGHQNLGAGRIVDQESVKITKDARAGKFGENVELSGAVEHAKTSNTNLHLMGIASDGGVHGLLEHLFALVELAKSRGLDRVYLHLFTDGRDTPAKVGLNYVKHIQARLNQIGVGKIATIVGRYFAMDRDTRWDRVEKAYQALTAGQGLMFPSATLAVEHYYKNPTEGGMVGDEFIPASVVFDETTHQQLPRIQDGDAVVFYNFRGDRPRELTHAFVDTDFAGFKRNKLDLFFVTMTPYEQGLNVRVAFHRPPKMQNILPDYLSSLGLKQFRCAETEKFPHVTFFFNDYREATFPGEDRYMARSPKEVSTYDQKPEMAAAEIAHHAAAAIRSKLYDFVLINFANADMVGHTGKLDAAIKAVEEVDRRLGEIIDATNEVGGSLIVTADHGNAEQMIDPATGEPHTSHTTFPVEMVLVDDRYVGKPLRQGGRLADIAPTILKLMGIEKPADMTGESLI